MPTNVVTERRPIARRIAVVSLAFVAVGLLGWLVKIMLFSEQTETMITAPATIGDIEETVLASGTLKPFKLVAVGAQVSGRVTTLKVSLGQPVKAGDLIAEIDSLPLGLALVWAVVGLQQLLR